jgi:nitrite reductase (NADH) small subunit
MAVRHRVGSLSEIGEDAGVRLEIGETIVAVFRVGDRIFAVGDQCPHMGASLSEGFLDGKLIVCPWHGWTFDLESGTSPFDDDAIVPVYRVVVEDGEVYVEVDEAASPPDHCPANVRLDEE